VGFQPPLTPALAALRDRLLAIPRRDGAALAAALAAPITFDDVRGFVRFDDEDYVRALIYRSDDLELRLHCWRPGQSSSLHGHGASACAFKIIRGTATETVLGDRDRVWPPGSIVVEDQPRLHQVMNAGSDALLTLHAYSPPLPVDAASRRRGRDVVIVGGGFAGVAVAYHLLREMDADGRIHLVEMGPWLGRGIAYGVESEVFRLNVPASRMSIDPDTPDDFVTFSGSDEPHAFLGRALYARYVTARLAATVRERPAKIRLWRGEAVAVTADSVVLRSGTTLPAAAVVLATGIVPRVTRDHWHAKVVDAWDECALATLPSQGRLLLLGSGLSALDVLAFLDAQGFAGEVTLISPRGLLPLPHEPVFASHGTPPLTAADVEQAPRALGPLMRWVRGTIASAVRDGVPWQRAVDRLRPHVTSLYRALPPAHRARFVRHVRPYWDVFRHRAPADAMERVERWARAGRLHRLAGRVTIDRRNAAELTVDIRERSGRQRRERFDAMVRCVGPALDVAEAQTPLLRSLIDGGLATLVPHGLGIETTPEGRLVDGHGEPSSRLYGIGAVRRASDWETTSVPDIARHALQLARAIAKAPGSAAASKTR
jgi:uncharacterized NAD(P)/FAD-binding protein YdhS